MTNDPPPTELPDEQPGEQQGELPDPVDPELLERQERTAYFWKAILLLLLMIVIAAIVLRKV